MVSLNVNNGSGKLCEAALSKLGLEYIKESVLFESFETPSLAILDIDVQESLQRLEQARSRGLLFPAIFIVGDRSEEYQITSLISDRFLFAPFNETIFARVVHGVLRKDRRTCSAEQPNLSGLLGGFYPQLLQVNRQLENILGKLRHE